MFQTEVLEKIKIYILYAVTFFFSENRATYEMWQKWYSWTGHR